MPRPGRKIFLTFTILATVTALAGVAGCLPGSTAGGSGQGGAAPVVETPPQPGLAEYRRRRPEAPEVFTVFPNERLDNTFGEFNEELHDSRGRQAALPELPGGVMAMAAPAYGMGQYPPQTAYPLPPGEVMSASGGRAGAGAGSAGRMPGREAGLTANDKHFYPLEQLVYGGEYPDADRPDSYRLMPKDVISVTVKDHPEFSGKVEVQADGTVRLPNAPDFIRLRGLTPDEAEGELRRVLGVYVRGECVVRVQTNRARGGYYFVLGDVLQPGRFPMGLEPLKLSDAVLAANWEANPARLDADGDELSPSFPAASPRGKFVSPSSADLARVALITPHRSAPARTTHDVRAAMLGVTAGDPVVRPGQIVVVPSLSAERNRELGLDALAGFSGSGSPARLSEAFPDNGPADYAPPVAAGPTEVERNMTSSYDANLNAGGEEVLYDEAGSGRAVYEGVPPGVSARELSERELPAREAPARWAGMSPASLARREVGRAGTPEQRVNRPAPSARRGWGIFGLGRGRAGGAGPSAAAAARRESASDRDWAKGF